MFYYKYRLIQNSYKAPDLFEIILSNVATLIFIIKISSAKGCQCVKRRRLGRNMTSLLFNSVNVVNGSESVREK